MKAPDGRGSVPVADKAAVGELFGLTMRSRLHRLFEKKSL